MCVCVCGTTATRPQCTTTKVKPGKYATGALNTLSSQCLRLGILAARIESRQLSSFGFIICHTGYQHSQARHMFTACSVYYPAWLSVRVLFRFKIEFNEFNCNFFLHTQVCGCKNAHPDSASVCVCASVY